MCLQITVLIHPLAAPVVVQKHVYIMLAHVMCLETTTGTFYQYTVAA